MQLTQLRQALCELNGERTAVFAFASGVDGGSMLTVSAAMLIPEESDALVKVTDGKSIYIIHSDQVMWVRIDLAGTLR